MNQTATETAGLEAQSSTSVRFSANWQWSKVAVFAVLAVCSFIGGIYEGLGFLTPELFEPASLLAIYIGVCIWLSQDRRRFRGVAELYGGLALYVFWLILFPAYLIQTRGWRRGLSAAGMVIGTWVVFSIAGYGAGLLLL